MRKSIDVLRGQVWIDRDGREWTVSGPCNRNAKCVYIVEDRGLTCRLTKGSVRRNYRLKGKQEVPGSEDTSRQNEAWQRGEGTEYLGGLYG